MTIGPRVALFMPDFGGGGVEITMLRLAQGLLAAGCRVEVVVARGTGALASRVPSGASVVDLDAGRALRTVPGLARYLRQARPDAVVAAPDHMVAIVLVARRIAGSATRVIGTVHNMITRRTAQDGGAKARAQQRAARLLLPRTNAVVAVSRGVAADLVENLAVPRSLVRVVPNPIPVEEIRKLAAEPVRHPWFEPGGPTVILGAGRLAPQKDFGMLLRAFARLRRTQACRLVILGDGPERVRLERAADVLGVAADVDLPGFADNPYPLMARAGVFALTSRYEGFGVVVAEALACGTRVVSTDCPSGPAEILGWGRYGTLVPVGDEAAAAAAIGAALKGPPPVPGDGALEPYRVETVAASYLAAINGQ